MKKFTLFFIVSIFSFCLTSCTLLDYIMNLFKKAPAETEIIEPVEETPEEPVVEDIIEPIVLEEIEPEEEIAEEIPPEEEVEEIVEIIEETEEIVVAEEPDVDEEEYLRSIDNLEGEESVSKTEFNEDKNAILNIIADLSVIMETKDVNKWLKYLEPDSIAYYSNPVNLRKAEKKLPNRTIVLRNIEDYFKYVFIPSRQRSQVDEIRYISKNSIKAVQVKEDKSIVVYYYFTKVGNKWLVHLPLI